MAKVNLQWSALAQSDLYRILEPIRQSAPKRSVALMKRLISTTERLSDFPESGRQPFEITDDVYLREIIVEKLRIFYDYRSDEAVVEILAVFDGRQDVDSLLSERFNKPL